MKEEKRIYVVLPATVQVPVRTVLQPYGRQIAQACHVVSKLRFEESENKVEPTVFQPITTIILQARDSNELMHNYCQLAKKLNPILFRDENRDVYGDFKPYTALAVLATPTQVVGILDYLPLWGS
jgi:hypothetical protein